MPTSRVYLSAVAEEIRTSFTHRAILCNSGTAIDESTSLAAILNTEAIQTTLGYNSQVVTFSTSTYNGTTNRQEYPVVTVTFSEDSGGSGYDYNYLVILSGAPANRQKTITAIDTSTNRLTITSHGITNGDRVVIRSTGGIPAGISGTTLYYAKFIDVNTIELYTDAGLTSIVDITGTGTGTIRLQYGNGTYAYSQSYPASFLTPGSSVSFQITGFVDN